MTTITTTDPDREHGLYGKYQVFKRARPEQMCAGECGTCGFCLRDPGPVFVLAYEKDPHAAVALAAYAKSCEDDFPQLAADLREKLREEPECECDEPACVWCEIHGETHNRDDEDDETDLT